MSANEEIVAEILLLFERVSPNLFKKRSTKSYKAIEVLIHAKKVLSLAKCCCYNLYIHESDTKIWYRNNNQR
jgi:hypothetical protein